MCVHEYYTTELYLPLDKLKKKKTINNEDSDSDREETGSVYR